MPNPASSNLTEKLLADPSFENYSILIVDDTPTNLKVIVEFLESYGFNLRITRSGENAIKRVQYDKPDLILLDVLMPGMDGFETCRRLKELELAKDIPIIFMTSLVSVEDKVKGFEVGALDYVTKPLQQEEVLARVKAHLRLRSQTLSLQEKHAQLESSSQVERNRLFEAIGQQREQLRALNQKLTEVQEAERRQLARELHDELGQALTAISINLATMLQELSPAGSPNLYDRLNESKQLADQTLEHIRELSFDLRPAMLDDLGLVSALHWYIKRCAQRVNIPIELDATELQERLPTHIETALYRIFQEALTNVMRHAHAHQVHLLLRRRGSTVIAQIEDDGCGFDMAQVLNHEMPKNGTGLLSMRERVALLGGTFNVHAEPGYGTRISIEIPLEVDA